MDDQSNILVSIEANLQQAIQRKRHQEPAKTLKFELNGQIRACCLSTTLTYSSLLKCIENLFGDNVLETIDLIQYVISRIDAFRLPVTNDDDVKKVLTIAETNMANKLCFLLIRKEISASNQIALIDTCGNTNTETFNDEQNTDSDDNICDSPPPGTLAPHKYPAIANKTSQAVVPRDGGLFIPESSDDTCSSGDSSVLSRDSSANEHRSMQRILKSLSKYSISSSNTSVSAGTSSNSSSSQASSNEVSRTQTFSFRHRCASPKTPTNWKLGRQLGQGAFGKVFLCYNVDTGTELAVKQISIYGVNAATKQIKDVKILEYEINILKQIRHKRIVRYHGVLQTDDTLQIFMEYMTGGSVREQILNYGALTEQLTKKYTKQILEGLVYLHRKHIVHRDIKCANILRDNSGNVKLSDFGTSRRLIAISGQNQLDCGTIGTAHWTAPEIIRENKLGRKVDVWSLGCSIVEMLTTGPPWQHLQPIAAIFHIATCEKPEYKLPENVSSLAREFIDLCLTKDYSRRPTSLDLMHHSFLLDTDVHHCPEHPRHHQQP